jgi:hypothetical protein
MNDSEHEEESLCILYMDQAINSYPKSTIQINNNTLF